MSVPDWFVLIGSIAFIVIYGIWKTRKSRNVENFLLGNHKTNWWTIGLSVMATQASAITFLSTPGQAYDDGMRFIQFYFGLPIAMVIICIFFIPRFFRMKVYTVYEYLEQRFDLRTRLLASFLFLVQRGLGAGITIFAPSIIFSAILGWNLNMMIIIIGVVVTLYTFIGGTRAVNVTHKLQMAVMMGGIITAVIITIYLMPEGFGLLDSVKLAGMHGKLNIVDFNFDFANRYTFWSGITGGTFLALAYFGTDQSQAQRYLSGQSIREGRLGLMFNGFFKVPMQFIILFAGVMVYVFYQFHPSPVFFNSQVQHEMEASTQADQFQQLQAYWNAEQMKRQELYANMLVENQTTNLQSAELAESLQNETRIREETKTLIRQTLPEAESNDRDYVFIRFILDFLPTGIIGLLISAILCASMSSTASELNALASTSTIDFYKRVIRQDGSERHYVIASKGFTILWGLIAMGFASVGSLFENLIQFVNIVGSIFYGTVLGIFLTAFFLKRASSTGVFYAALVAQTVVLFCFWKTEIGFLWYNVIGCSIVMFLSFLISAFQKNKIPV